MDSVRICRIHPHITWSPET